jgi:hypothetical protein
MKSANDNSADVTNLKPCDHQAFFEALDSPPLLTEALRATFRRRKEAFVASCADSPSTN